MSTMTWAGLVWKNLARRPVRTALTAAGVGLGVALIVALLSITTGVRRTAEDLIHIGRADFGLFQEGVSDFTRSLLPESLAARVEDDPGVVAAARIFLHVTPVGGQESFLLFGLEPDEFTHRRLVIVDGRPPRGAELLVGDKAASSLHVSPGNSLRIGTRSFPIAGIYHSGDRFEDIGGVLPLRVVQRLAGRPGEVTTVGVTVRQGERPETVAKRLEERFPGIATITEPGQAVKVDTSSRLILDAGWIISALALIVGGIGVTNTMAMSVFERVREIGILRAVGWPTRRIASLIVSEAVGICLIGLTVGVGLGILGAWLFTRSGRLSDLIEPRFTVSVFAWGLAFALGVALLGAIYPTLRAVRLTPAEALRHE
jgi:putative ABC transport system permease protein